MNDKTPVKFVDITETQYLALTTKDPGTVYFVHGSSGNRLYVGNSEWCYNVVDYDDLTDKPSINGVTLSGSKTSDDLKLQDKMVVLSYGHSTWAEFDLDYHENAVVYCRASSNSDPATGSQTRLAFMAYVNNGDNPTEVEFQYYRSVATHSATQQGDQVYVYKLTKTGGWTVTVREASVNIAAGSGLSRSYNNGVVTLDVTGKQDTLVSGTNIKTINNESVLGSGNISITSDVTDVTVDGTSVVSSGVAAIDLTGKADISSLATVATSGSYSDLSNKPTIPTKTSDLTNDSGFVSEDSNGDVTITRNINLGGDATIGGDVLATGDVVDGTGNVLSGKQDTLVSGTNIKTINNISVLGNGNIDVSSGGTITVDTAMSDSSTNPVQNKVIKGYVDSSVGNKLDKTGGIVNSGFSLEAESIDLDSSDGDTIISPSDGGEVHIDSVVTPVNSSDAANKGYVDNQIVSELAQFEHLDYEVVQSLPSVGDPGVRYLLYVSDSSSQGYHYEEYMYVENQWIDIGRFDEIDEATETTSGTIKLNSAQSIGLDSNGKLTVGGRLGQFPTTTGIYAPNNREPRMVGDYSFLITDAMAMDMTANRAFALVTGLGITCRSAAAGATQYRIKNTYSNRINAKLCENGYASRDEATSKVENIVPVVSVQIAGSSYTPDSSADQSATTQDIIITTEETLNPDSAITSIRLFGKMTCYATAHIGNGIASWGGGRNLLLGGGISKDGNGNDNCVVANGAYVNGNGNGVFGRFHIVRKNRGFFAGQGHDSTNASSEGVSALGQYSYIDANTMFAVGNGTGHTARSNAFEVTKTGDAKAAGNITDGSGNVLANKIEEGDIPGALTYYGVCTQSGTGRDVTLGQEGYETFTLTRGVLLSVKFTYAITTSTTISVDSEKSPGSVRINYKGSALAAAGVINAGDTALLQYDGTYWEVISVNTATSFKIVELQISNSEQIAAHGYQAIAAYTVPAANRPAGMTLVGIVGYASTNYRLQSTSHFVSGDNEITANIVNTSATNVAAGNAITFRLLYIRAQSI